MSFGQVRIKPGSRNGFAGGFKTGLKRVCSDTMKVGFKRVFAATDETAFDHEMPTTNLEALAEVQELQGL